MDLAMEGSSTGKKRKTLSPSSAVSRGSVDCMYVLFGFLILSCFCIFLSMFLSLALISVFVFCREVLMDLTNLSGTKIKVTPEKETRLNEADCKIILSPLAFGLFDFGINRALNKNSPLYLELKSSVKVESNVEVVIPVSFFSFIGLVHHSKVSSIFCIHVFW